MKFAITALLAAAANACDNEWIWEECSWMYYRWPCDDEGWGDGEDVDDDGNDSDTDNDRVCTDFTPNKDK